MTSDPHPTANLPSNSPEGPPEVATGNRFAETRLEPDDGQLARVAHLAKPEGPLPRHEATTGAGLAPHTPGAPVEDVKLDASGSSVWDARPPERRALEDVPDPGAPQASPLRDAAPGEGAEGRTGDDGHPKPPFPPAELVSKRAGG
ncbi:MAG: hypothetical protein JSS35_17720 [Proteobacteria bacterium]|nr:hypothetical protein [Pseudomonadota bacterium]